MNEPWWKRAIVYQIYPKSFKDTTGNGEGDLKGVIEKLDYLEYLGVDVIWLNPIYASPQKDNGYDIRDYYSIDTRFGSMEDFDTLLKEAHQRRIRVIMDIVVNHTSTEHEWFKRAKVSRDSAYRDFYIWRDPVEGHEPNNWKSKFGGSAWQYDERTGQYYLHLFDVSQADLNWENHRLRQHIYDMMRFWLEKGVDGFRFDVINLISKHQDFPNDVQGDGRQYYTDGPLIHKRIHDIHQEVFAGKDVLTVGEMSSTSIRRCVDYTKPEREELNMTFSFHHLKVDYLDGQKWMKATFDFLELKRILSEWQVGMYRGGGWNALFWCNHDQPRVVSRFGDDNIYRKKSAKMLATTMHMMQGTPYIYQGEEIGMTNPGFDQISDYRDVESLNMYHILKEQHWSHSDIMAVLRERSRDNARTPLQWDASANAGFTTGEPWIKIPQNFMEINVAHALQDPDSIFYHYKRLIEIRKRYDIITYGDYECLNLEDPQLFTYLRRWQNEKLFVISNFYSGHATYTFSDDNLPNGSSRILLSNYEDSKIEAQHINLRPYESLVIHVLKSL